jgi:hypothetical protein
MRTDIGTVTSAVSYRRLPAPPHEDGRLRPARPPAERHADA